MAVKGAVLGDILSCRSVNLSTHPSVLSVSCVLSAELSWRPKRSMRSAAITGEDGGIFTF